MMYPLPLCDIPRFSNSQIPSLKPQIVLPISSASGSLPPDRSVARIFHGSARDPRIRTSSSCNVMCRSGVIKAYSEYTGALEDKQHQISYGDNFHKLYLIYSTVCATYSIVATLGIAGIYY